MKPALCFAVPGGNTMIDEVHPQTGLSVVYRQSLEQIRERYPDAQIMAIDAWCQSRGAAQDTPVVWVQCSEERFHEMLEVLPPAAHTKRGFLVGEAMDHHAVSGAPRFAAFIRRTTQGDGWSETQFYESSRPMTWEEFRVIA